MKRPFAVGVLGITFALIFSTSAFAQGAQADDQLPSEETRSATTTASGTTGIWYVPTGEVLPARKWSLSLYRTNLDDGQGFTDISTFPATFAVGLGGRAEIFGSWLSVVRIDRDSRPLFFTTTPEGDEAGTGGGIVPDYPKVSERWIGNKRGDLWVGAKINLLADTESPAAVAVRGAVKLPIGDDEDGASSGATDFQLDGIVSMHNRVVEVSGYAGFMMRGNPDGYDLTNGLRWGIGAALPQSYNLGFKLSAELFGEKYFDDSISAPAGLLGVDGSLVPTSTRVKGPVVASVGVTWQAPNGFFIGGAASVNVSMKGRDEAGFPSTPKDDKGLQVRLGYHPGVRDRTVMSTRTVAPPPPPVAGAPDGPGAGPGAGGPGAAGPGAAGPGGAAGPAGPGAAGGPGAAPQNRPPTVDALCDPCTVEVGRTATVTANAQDPDGDALTYQWTTGSGTLAAPTARQSSWTAPMQPGTVPFTVTVNDGKGGTASDSVNIQVIRPAQREYAFEDVHFEFDRYTLRSDALRVLDEAITAMQANASLRLEIEGHTCNIGTPEYNLALGERRAVTVRDYLVSRGISAARLGTVSYGEERPKHDNAREETRRLNRRASLVVRLQ